MLKLGDKNISKLYLGNKSIIKAFLGNKLVFQAGGRFVESIISDRSSGKNYIDTNIKPSYDYTVKMKFQYTDVSDIYNPIFGTRLQAVATGNNVFWVGYSAGSLMLRLGGNSINYQIDKSEIVELEASPSGVFVNGVDTGARYYDGEIASNIYNITLLGVSDNSTNGIHSGMGNANAQVYYYQVLDKEGKAIQDLRPYVDENGTACFKDIVTGNLFYNQGTGTLTYTE